MSEKNALLRTGIIGSVIMALCCFTPILVVLFGVIGFSALVGYLDYVLLPALALFVTLTGYALYRRHNIQQKSEATHGNGENS